MASDWEVVSLDKQCLKIGSGATPRGGSNVYLEEGEISLIRSQNIYNEGFSKDGLVYITKESADKLKNVIVEEDDILLNITGDSVARVCMVDNTYLPARVNQHVLIIRPKPSSFNPKFLRYYLSSPYAQQLLLNYSSAGATRKALTKNMIENLDVPMPDIKIQNSIAHTLSILDDKIELNRQMNETLEAMAQTLFKSWFVDFDPVLDNALQAGNDIPDDLVERAEQRQAMLDSGKIKPNTAVNALFPSEFEFNEDLGWIPMGWKISSFSKLAILDTTSVKPNQETEKIWEHYSIPAFDVDKSPVFDLGESIKSNKYKVNKNAILVSKLNPTTERIWWVDVESEDAAICSTEFMQFIPINDANRVFIYNLVRSYPFQKEILSRVTGSTGSRQRAQPKSVAEIDVLVPTERLLNKFSITIKDFKDRTSINIRQNQTLAKLRDTLLPKLMSGELRIGDAVTLVDEV